jgi:hypothetical protein
MSKCWWKITQEVNMKKIFIKICDGIFLTSLCLFIIGGGMLMIISLILSIKYFTEGNWDKFFEFLTPLVISPIVIYLSFEIGAFYRSKTKDFSDLKDTSLFDSFIRKK